MMPVASAEAQAAFGDGGVYVEKLIERARHVEVQVLGDGSDVIHLYRARMLAAAPPPEGVGGGAVAGPFARGRASGSAAPPSALAKAVDYRGAGTLEFLYDDATGRLLLHRDEHPHPGRAPGDRAGDRHRSRPRDAADRRRRTSPPPPGGHRAPRPRHRGPHQRRGPVQRLHAIPRQGRRSPRCPAVRASASTPCSMRATRSRPSTTRSSAS